MVASLPDKEEARLAALHETGLLDTPPEAEYDDVVRLAAFICGTPIATVTFVDSQRQWFKAVLGLERRETPRDIAFCAHTILQRELFIVPDATADSRFFDNPLVTSEPGIRFYAGAPLITEDGHALGTLCVIDRIPRKLEAGQEDALRTLARQVSHKISETRRVAERERLVAEKERLMREKELFAAEQKRAEESLRRNHDALERSQARLAEAQRVAQIGSWEYDISGDKIAWSEELFRLFGIEPSEGEPSVQELLLRYHPDDVAMHTAFTSHAIQDGEPYEFDIRIVQRDGAFRWAHAVGRGEKDSYGRVVRLFGTLMDIHGRKAMEEALRDQAEKLRQSEAVLRAVLESAPVILYATDAAGTIILSEGSGLATLGLAPGELVGRSAFEFGSGAKKRAREVQEKTRRALAGEAVAFDIEIHELCLHTVLRPIQSGAEDDAPLAGIIGVSFDVTERKEAEQKIRDHAIVLEFQNGELEKVNAALASLAVTDSLTGLRNHGAFQARLIDEVVRAARYRTPLSLILLDVDRFKRYNDAYGHPAGDFVIKMVGTILQACARDTDLVARYGGEEFVLILPQTDLAGAAIYAERVRAAIENYPWPTRAVTASFGVAMLRQGEEGGADLIARADAALYQAKSAGRNRVACLPGVPVAAKLTPKVV